jgi:hypothetical protein
MQWDTRAHLRPFRTPLQGGRVQAAARRVR